MQSIVSSLWPLVAQVQCTGWSGPSHNWNRQEFPGSERRRRAHKSLKPPLTAAGSVSAAQGGRGEGGARYERADLSLGQNWDEGREEWAGHTCGGRHVSVT